MELQLLFRFIAYIQVSTNNKGFKMKLLSEMSNKDMDYFDDIMEPLVKWIKSTWNWKGLKPKGYKKYLSNYEDYQDINEIDTSKFEGIVNNTMAGSIPFPESTSIPHVAYDDTNQGRDPLTVLMSRCVSYGMSVGKKRYENNIEKIIDEHNNAVKRNLHFIALELNLDKSNPEHKKMIDIINDSESGFKLAKYQFNWN